jgi:uncharacterized membrane protein
MKTDLLPLERTLGRVLTIGTWLSTSMLALGLLATFFAPASAITHGLLTAGLLALLLTPVARVAVSVIGFVNAREWWFVLAAAVVLALLVSSFAVAFA